MNLANIKKSRLSWKQFWKLRRYKYKKFTNRILLDQNGMERCSAGYVSLGSYKNSQKKIKKILNILPNESILDYGSGNCLLVSYFLKNNIVYCYDVCNNALEIGKLIFKDLIILKKKEIKKFKYDHIICCSVFQYCSLKESKKLLSFFNRIAKKSFFIIDIPNLDTKEENIKLRKKFKLRKLNYQLPQHTYYKKSFFMSFAKKLHITAKFFNNVLDQRQKKFRFSVLFNKK